jgi:hypothetical protein
MDDLDQLNAALLKADAAGDTASAKILADHIRQVTAQTPQPKPQAKQQVGTLANAWDGVKNLGIGLYRGVMDPIDGGAQLAAHGVASAAHFVAPGTSVDKFFADQARGVDDINTNRENAYQKLTPGSVTAGVGRIGGNIIVPIKGTQATRGASLGARLASGVTTGALVGAAQPVFGAGDRNLESVVSDSQPVDYWSAKAKQVGLGAVLGGGLSGTAAALGGLAKAVRPLVSPKATVGDQILRGLGKAEETAGGPVADTAGGDVVALTGSRAPSAVLERLRSATPLVEGSLPTTAQVAGVPELVMAEKTLKNNPAYRGPFEDRAIANNAARLGKLLSIAKTPADLQAAITARSAEAGPLYDAAKAATLPVDSEITDLLSRPSAQQAIKRGMALAAERGEQVSLDGATPATNAVSSILDASGKPLVNTLPAQSGRISGNMLQYLKMGLDDLQSAGRTQGIGSHEAKALSDTQDALTGWMERNSPDFAKANATYAKLSQPINTMQAAQDLHQGLSSGTLNAAGDVSPMLSQYRTQLAKALKNAPYGIEPEAQQSLEAIQKDLQRESTRSSRVDRTHSSMPRRRTGLAASCSAQT